MKVRKLSGMDLADVTLSDGVVKLVPCGEDRLEDMLETERQDAFSGCYSCGLSDQAEAKRLFFTGKQRFFAIIRECDEKYAGYCMVHDITKSNWELGISLLAEMRGQGLGVAAYGQLIGVAKRAHRGASWGKLSRTITRASA